MPIMQPQTPAGLAHLSKFCGKIRATLKEADSGPWLEFCEGTSQTPAHALAPGDRVVLAQGAPLVSRFVEGGEHLLDELLLDHLDLAVLLQDLARHVERQVVGIDHALDEPQVRALIASFQADGCWVVDPHTWVLEDGGMKQMGPQQLDFKKQADPLGLMNPGKVRAWDEQVLGIAGGQL